MAKIQNIAAYFFITAVAILSIVSVLGVWNFFDRDVIIKSFSTLGLLAVVAVVVMVAGRFLDSGSAAENGTMIVAPDPTFPVIRKMTLTLLIVAVSLLALLGVMAIWELIKDKDVLYKSLGSLGVLAFGAFVMTMTCLEREGKLKRGGKGVSIGAVIGIIFLIWIFFAVFSGFFYR